VTGDRACLSYAPDVGHPPASPADAWRCCLAAPARHAQAAPRWTRGRAAAEPGQGPGGRGEKGGEGVAAGHERRKGGRGSRSVWEMPHDLRQRRRKQRGRDCGMHPSGVKRCRPSQHALLPLCTSLPPPHTSGTTSAVGSEWGGGGGGGGGGRGGRGAAPPPPPPPLPTHPTHTTPPSHLWCHGCCWQRPACRAGGARGGQAAPPAAAAVGVPRLGRPWAGRDGDVRCIVALFHQHG
jgi:hypothetical protein